jgi:dTDP-4-dehydrorhamnose reductase
MKKELKKILITGSDGMLGLAFQKILSDKYPNIDIKPLSKELLDVKNHHDTMSFLEYNPDVIIHCAAIVNADYCENNYDDAYQIMIEGTKNIINLANKCNAKIFYPQSFLIFDGLVNPVLEDTEPEPLSLYGKLKYESEKLILSTANHSIIVRMGGFFGGYKKDKNYVGKIVPDILNRIKNNIGEIEVGDRIWQPTYTEDLALNCLLLILKDKEGIYNMASHNETSFYEFTVKIVEYLNLGNFIKVIEVSSEQFDNAENAKRPHSIKLINKRLIKEGLDMQGKWEISLEKYLNGKYYKKLINKGLDK